MEQYDIEEDLAFRRFAAIECIGIPYLSELAPKIPFEFSKGSKSTDSKFEFLDFVMMHNNKLKNTYLVM